MIVELKDLSPVKKTLSIEAGLDEVALETDEVARQYRKQAKIPGFRKGKVPLDQVRRRFAKEISDEVRDRMLSRLFREATTEHELQPLGEPTVDELDFAEGKPLKFTTTFEVLPPLEVRGYKDVKLQREPVSVGDADVDQALEELRQSRVQLVVEEGRVAEVGDVVVADVEGKPVGEGEGFNQEGVAIELGAENNLPAFNEKLQGVKAGEQAEFSVEYPEDYTAKELAGKTIEMSLKVQEVKRKQLPDLDDEFAKDLGEFDNLAALRARVLQDLEARRAQEEERASRQAVLDQVLLDNPVVLPDVLVEHETRARLEEIARSMIMQGMDPQKAEVDWVEMRKGQEESARKTVHARLVLDAVAKMENVEVKAADVEQRISQDAERMREPVEKLKERLEQGGGTKALKTQMVRERALDYLTSVANIQYSK